MGPQRTSALTVTDTSSFSEIEYGGHNQTVRYDGIISPTWLRRRQLRARLQQHRRDAERQRVARDRHHRRAAGHHRRHRLLRAGQQGHQPAVRRQDHVSSPVVTRSRAASSTRTWSTRNINQRTGPTFTAPDGRQTATGAQVNIVSDPAFSRIYRVIRANFIDARVTTQNYWSFFVQDTWRVGERLTINPGLRYEEQTLVGNLQELTTLQGNTIDDFALKGNWAPRVGAVYDVLGNGRSKLYGNYGRFFARIPNDLAARALSAPSNGGVGGPRRLCRDLDGPARRRARTSPRSFDRTTYSSCCPLRRSSCSSTSIWSARPATNKLTPNVSIPRACWSGYPTGSSEPPSGPVGIDVIRFTDQRAIPAA